jgi:hypothetical protein
MTAACIRALGLCSQGAPEQYECKYSCVDHSDKVYRLGFSGDYYWLGDVTYVIVVDFKIIRKIK